MCNCGCNTCETKGPLLTEGKVKSLLSEGLQYHIDKKIPLFETVYRIGSDKHLSLIREARKMYSRNVIDLCEEDEALIKTNLGEFALYEGVSIPLDLPMLNESYDYDEVAQSEFGMDYDQLGSGEKEWVRDEIDNMSMNESNSNYPDFDLNKNIRYQDTSISSGMWRYTGQEQGGKGVYRNLNNGQILAFDRSDFAIFRNNLSSHFDFSESLNESKYEKEESIQQTIDRLKARIEDPNDGGNVSFLTQKIKDLEKYLDEVTIKERIVNILEAKKKKAKKKDNRPIGKPMRDTSGGKAYKVYVKDPKTKKVKTVRFGSGGLRAKINDSKARKAFAARHKCSQKKDRTKASYWSCRLPRYAKLLGLKSSFSGFW
jgi:hypothetical protein